MSTREQEVMRPWPLLFCVLLSLLLHLLLVYLLQQNISGQQGKQTAARTPVHQVHVQVRREPKPQQQRRPFAKTDPDQAEQLPFEADHVGNRSTTAASERLPDSDALAPSMEGRMQEELNTLSRERQDGDLLSEALGAQSSETPDSVQPPDLSPSPAQPAADPVSPSSLPPSDGQQEVGKELVRQTDSERPLPASPQDPSVGKPEGLGRAEQGEEAVSNATSPVARPEPLTEEESPEGKPVLPQTESVEEREKPDELAVRVGQTDEALSMFDPSLPTPALRSRPVYDPSLPASAQPGFRTAERRSRSSGTFICGRNPSLNVAATPRGAYEAQVYRRIARSWYFHCDEHRGDILPGSLGVSVCVDSRGLIKNLQLLGRRGASVLQQSFTFRAIREASLPPMPEAVKRELGDNLLEIVIIFHFD